MSRLAAALGVLCVILSRAVPAHAQALTWSTAAAFYADNTEFFTPYRTGETLLGGQFRSELRFRTGTRTGFHLGAFGDHRSGAEEFLETIHPVLTFQYRSPRSTGTIGAMFPERRRGYLEPLQATTFEITRPIEYGLSWRERRPRWEADVFINWQRLNLEGQREAFDFGWILKVHPLAGLTLETQLHGLHHGGQLFDAGVPVTNNTASSYGATLADSLPWAGKSALALHYLRSSGNLDPGAPAGRPDDGHGWYLRASVAPRGWFELFSISWWGRDFLAQEGDNNYNSVGADDAFYRSRRKYWELGVLRRSTIEEAVTLDAELRFHRIDNYASIAIGKSRWEYSYRVLIRAPWEAVLK